MLFSRKVKVAFYAPASLLKNKTIESYLEAKWDPSFRILRIIAETMNFSFQALPYETGGKLLENGSWTGAVGMINRSEVDMTPDLILVNEERQAAIHFCYPYRLYAATFVIAKPEYSPQIFGLFKAFSSSIWLTVVLLAIAMTVIKLIFMKGKYSLSDVLLHVISICLRQSSMLHPWTISQNILMYNWMAGAMIMGFCYTSVLLSFLTFPSTQKIRDMPDLARAVEEDSYKCMLNSHLTATRTLLVNSDLESLVKVGKSMLDNPGCFGTWEDFLRLKKEKVAFFDLLESIPALPDGYFTSSDYILECMAAMATRRDFCCKEQLDAMVHRILAAGIYVKVKNDKTFLSGLNYYRSRKVEISSERSLTLTEFYLAFMILIIGCTFSVSALIAEIILDYHKKN